MKIGMFTSGYQRNPLEHCFQDAKEYGYDYIELWGGRPHAYPYDLKAGDINEVRRLIDQYEMPVYGYTPEHNAYPFNYMIGSEAQREDAVAYLKTAIDMAKEMGSDFVLTSPANGGYLATYGELWTRLEKTIRELGDYAAKKEIHLVVEALTPYESNFFTRANDLVELFRRVDNPYVVGMCDVVLALCPAASCSSPALSMPWRRMASSSSPSQRCIPSMRLLTSPSLFSALWPSF